MPSFNHLQGVSNNKNKRNFVFFFQAFESLIQIQAWKFQFSELAYFHTNEQMIQYLFTPIS